MVQLKDVIIKKLKSLDIYKLKFENENEFEDYIYDEMDKLLKTYDKSILLKRQIINKRGSRQLKPDITIGFDEVLIELKYDVKGLNDIYRLFYQAFKYSRIAKVKLILYVYDPKKKITSEDIEDLETFDRTMVIRKL